MKFVEFASIIRKKASERAASLRVSTSTSTSEWIFCCLNNNVVKIVAGVFMYVCRDLSTHAIYLRADTNWRNNAKTESDRF